MRDSSFALLAWLLSACSSPPGSLVVDVRTDLVPEVEFDVLEVVIDGEPAVLTSADASLDFLTGARVAEFDDLSSGSHRLTIIAVARGEPVLERSVLVEVDGARAVTVLMTRDCAGVMCGAGQSCVGGTCASESCTPETPAECPPPECSADPDCGAPTAMCASARCVEGTCFDLDDGSCGPGSFCRVDDGCRDRGAVIGSWVAAASDDAVVIGASVDGPVHVLDALVDASAGGSDVALVRTHPTVVGRALGGAGDETLADIGGAADRVYALGGYTESFATSLPEAPNGGTFLLVLDSALTDVGALGLRSDGGRVDPTVVSADVSGVSFGVQYRGSLMIAGALHSSPSEVSWLVVSADPDGAATWAWEAPVGVQDITGVARTGAAVVVGGTFSSPTDFGAGVIDPMGSGVWMVALDEADGSALWSYTLLGGTLVLAGVEPVGRSVIAAGHAEGAAMIDDGTNMLAVQDDAWFVRLAPDGTPQWLVGTTGTGSVRGATTFAGPLNSTWLVGTVDGDVTLGGRDLMGPGPRAADFAVSNGTGSGFGLMGSSDTQSERQTGVTLPAALIPMGFVGGFCTLDVVSEAGSRTLTVGRERRFDLLCGLLR